MRTQGYDFMMSSLYHVSPTIGALPVTMDTIQLIYGKTTSHTPITFS